LQKNDDDGEDYNDAVDTMSINTKKFMMMGNGR
jgi:hypothetical protein